jgi:prolyl 4-hydroxylase
VNDPAPPPNPDQAALASAAARVCDWLDDGPGVYKVPVETADIWTRGEFLTAEECARLIAMIDDAAEPSGLLDHGYTEAWRTSSSANFDRADPFVEEIEARIDAFVNLPHEWGETIQGQRYAVGQEFRHHLDSFWTLADYWPDEARRGGQRVTTAMIYLNDIAEGGETDFPRLRASVPPQQGVILAWNNVLADGEINQNTMHAGLPVGAGTKYIITKWYRTRPWGEPG